MEPIIKSQRLLGGIVLPWSAVVVVPAVLLLGALLG